MTETRLTPTSYVVLGLIEQMEPASPYDLKRAVAMGVGQFWSLPHTQLYSECGRLAEAGLLSEKREESRRAVSRRKSKNTSFIGRICPVNV